MSAAYSGGTKGGTYERHYYVCSHRCTRGGYIPVCDIEATAEPFIVARLEELKEDLAHEPKPDVAPKPAPDFGQRRAKLSSKRERYLEAFAENLMSREELRAALIKLADQVLKIEAQEQESKKTNPLMDGTIRRAVLKEIAVIKRAWGSATPQAQREIVGHLAAGAWMAKGKKLSFQWRNTEDLAAPAVRGAS